ncbi:MAG: heparinase II/III family protein [Candidatus Manganitrophus sp. SA1]|nr:heparinase II/III family protein [Candidatus Manganitrophus morganii]
MANLKWMVKRLRVMGPTEIAHRIGEQWTLKMMAARYRMGRGGIVSSEREFSRFEFCRGTAPKLPTLPIKMTDPEEIDRLLSGKIKIGDWFWQWRPEGAVWHEAPDTGKIWPRLFFGSISYRPGNQYGDIRIAWEPSRLQQLVGLGLLSKEASPEVGRQAADLLEAQFLSWIEANPFLTGIHYISAMECGLRLIAACHALDLVRDRLRDPESVWFALIRLIEEHASLIEKRLSVHSSVGNHTLAEAAGLIYAGVLFPEMRGADRWRGRGLSLLEKEADHQILPDGGGVEQAFHYLRFGVDLYQLVFALLIHQAQPIPPALREATQRGRRFLGAVADTKGRVPSIGDSDDGHALSPSLRFGSEEGIREGLTSFNEAGYSLIRSGQAVLRFDHGSLGMPPLCGHGHADALSVTLRIGENEFLIDPGTYSYADLKWRAYFRGTAAHNTVVVDRQDQAIQEAPFIWSNPFDAKVVQREALDGGGIRLLASHQGYARSGVTHWRAVFFEPPGSWLIWDFLAGAGKHLLDLYWHLGVEPSRTGDFFRLSDSTQIVSLSAEGGALSLHRGETDPILGWRAPVYGSKEPITTIRVRHEGTLPHSFLTRIALGPVPTTDHAMTEALAALKEWIS